MIYTKFLQQPKSLDITHSRMGHYFFSYLLTLESGIDVGQEITVGPGKFVKKNKRRALNKRRA